MKLRYVGVLPVTFTDQRIGELHPGDEFTIPDDDAPPFLTLTTVELVPDAPSRSSTRAQPTLKPADSAEVTSSRVTDVVATDNR